MTKRILKMAVSANGIGTSVVIYFNGLIVWQGDPGVDPQKLNHEFEDVDNNEHTLLVEFSGKTHDHTKFNKQGEIISDLLVHIGDFFLDNIAISQLVWEKAKYYHNFNGSSSAIIDHVYGAMGCNGRVEFKFMSPVYLWLLENT